MTSSTNTPYIDTEQGLRDLVDRMRGAEAIAVDTEFMRERTYWAKLCLVQVGDGEHAAAVDPFAIEDLSPLFELLDDPDIVKVFHSGEQDLEIFWRLSGRVPAPVFDTQVAAALASFPLQAGYGLLVKELLGVELDKTSSYTDWARRPLSERQITYALDDVVYLPEVYRLLKERLEAEGRLDWLEADFERLADPASYEVVPEETYKRVKRRNRLRRRQLGVLQHVAAWREREAVRRDIPRGRVLGDEALVQIASRQPQTREDLARIRGVHDSVVKRDAKGIFAAVRAGLDMPESDLPTVRRRSGRRADVDAMTDLMSALVRTRAAEYGIAVPVLASRKQMVELARGERDESPLLEGWRRSHIGEELVDLMEGRISLSLDDERVVVERDGEQA
jgi:ribonuclease D